MRALVVGGTGPTGPFIVNGLLERGYEVTIFHRGTHEVPEIGPEVTHIHGDPHFPETIAAALGDRTWDLTVATYGRIRHLAEALAGRTERFLAVGGVAVYRGFMNGRQVFPRGMVVPIDEDAPLVTTEAEQRFSWLMVETEKAVLAHHPTAAVFRYPYVYGPYQLVPREWCVIRRLLDGRRRILVPDGGLSLFTHGWAGNLAHAVLLAADQPEASAGRVYNVGDTEQLTLSQVIEVIAARVGVEVEIVSIPHEAAAVARPLLLGGWSHNVMDIHRVRAELGYTDVLGVRDALARTTDWYVENRPEPGGEIERRLDDRFDYDAEDELLARLDRALADLREVEFATSARRPHPYAHPKRPGAARDHRDR